MFTKYFKGNTKQITDREASQDKSATDELGAYQWKLTEIIVCYSDEYATDITDILNKTISQEIPQPLLTNRFNLDGESWHFRPPANFFSASDEALAKFAVRRPKYEGMY